MLLFSGCKKKINSDLPKALQLLKITNQSPLSALELEITNFLSLRDNLFNSMLNTIEQSEHAISVVNTLLRENPKLVLQILIMIFMDVLRLQLNADDFVVNQNRLPMLQKLKVAFSLEKVLLLLQQLQEAWRLVESVVAINLQLLLEEVFLTIAMNHNHVC